MLVSKSFDLLNLHKPAHILTSPRFTPYPARDAPRDPAAYKAAIDALPRGSAITIFTPDTTHFEIGLYAIRRGVHVLVTKPAVKTLKEHMELVRAAQEEGVYV